MIESIVDKNFSIFYKNFENVVEEKNIESLVENFNDLPVDFALIDLGYINLRNFNKTYIARLLNKYEIPYFTVELPNYVKEHFSEEIIKIQNKFEELKLAYDIIDNKNTASAQELRFLMDQYSNELEEIDRHINLQLRTENIINKILAIVENRKDGEFTFVHFGEENTFIEILQRLKKSNVKTNVLFIPKQIYHNLEA